MKVKLRYLKSLMLHKWYVLVAGLRLGGIPLWRLLIHDWSKFSSWEFGQYARYFHGDLVSDLDRERAREEFTVAWLHHENLNPHHVGYWIPRTGQKGGISLRMPQAYVREHVADMMGASRGYTGSWDMTEWLEKNLHKILVKMHVDSELYLLHMLFDELGYELEYIRLRFELKG